MAQVSTADMDVRLVRPSDIREEVNYAMNRKRPVFIWGPPGIGKSEIVSSITQERSGYMIDMRLALMEPTDLRGIPVPNIETGLMEWLPPADLPTQELADQFECIVLFLDEMNQAPQSVQAAAYQLILNRRLGNYRLPDNVLIVAAGNRESDRGVAYRMPSALANRFVHLEMTTDFEDWQTWEQYRC
jgi:MoxR-like ATPase